MGKRQPIRHKKHKDHDLIIETMRTSVDMQIGVFGAESANKAYENELVPIKTGINEGVTRPFITPQFFFNQKEIQKEVPKIMGHRTKADWDTLGTKLAIKMINFVDDKRNFTPNAPATIAKKGFDSPLHETGQMVNDIDYKIKKVRR